jgi:transposase
MSEQEQEELLTTLWDLQGFKVVGVEVEAAPTETDRGRRVQVVRLWNERRTHRCPRCGREHHQAFFEEAMPRRFRDSSLGEWETFVEITPIRVRCCGGMLVEAFPFEAPGGHRMTRRFFERLAALCTRLPVQTVAEMAGLSWDTVARVDREAIRLALGGDAPSLDGLRWIGVDEVSRTGGRVYFTIVTDLIEGRVVWVGDGKGKKPLEAFFRELGGKRCKKIQGVVSDLAEGFLQAIAEAIPQARHVLDRFHIIQWANEALNEVRRRIFGGAPGKGTLGQEIKAKKWMLLTARERLKGTDRRLLDRLRTLNAPLYTAYLLKEELRAMLHHSWAYMGALLRNLKAWAHAVHKAGHAEFVKVANRLLTHFDKLAAGFGAGVRLGLVEAINGKIALIRRESRGIRNQQHFRFKIYQRCSLPNNPWAKIAL